MSILMMREWIEFIQMQREAGKREMKELLVVVDMQTDFVDGALGTGEAQSIVENVVSKVKSAKECGKDIIFTMDTHQENYLDTQEGKHLPIVHCVKGSKGWGIVPQLQELTQGCKIIEKPSFGSIELAHSVSKEQYERIELIGLCTDICVISNAMILKASLPEAKIFVDAKCCAGVSQESHQNALEAMKMCQIEVIE